MTSSSLVLVGAVGWLHSEWQNGFYPEGLPDDWLLSYYNTQFQAVYLPAAVWQVATETDWEQWLNDTRAGFFFVLEPGEAVPVKPASERVLLATPDWEAGHIWWLDEVPDLRALAQRVTQQAATGEPLFVFSRSGDIGLLEQVKTLARVMGY